MHPFSFEQLVADTAENFVGGFRANVEALLATVGSQLSEAASQPLLLVVMVGFLAACAGISRSWSCRRARNESS
jgi:hypothetical protein